MAETVGQGRPLGPGVSAGECATPTGRRTVPEELVERRCGADRNVLPGVQRNRGPVGAVAGDVSFEVDRSVEDHRPHSAREEVGVDRAELSAVRDAVIGQRRIADRAAQQLEIACGVGGRGVIQDRPRTVPTAVGEPLRPREELVLRRGVGGQPRAGYEVLPLFCVVGKAAHGRAAGYPALVPGDEIEARSQLIGEQPRPPRPLAQPIHPGITGTTEVDEQRADSLARIGRRQLDHRQVDLFAVRQVVVHRDSRCRTKESVITRSPGQIWRIGGLSERVDKRVRCTDVSARRSGRTQQAGSADDHRGDDHEEQASPRRYLVMLPHRIGAKSRVGLPSFSTWSCSPR